MKQGEKRKLAPKDKHTKASWKKRDEGRKGKQEAHFESLTAVGTDNAAEVVEELTDANPA